MEVIQEYKNQKFQEINLLGLTRTLPLCRVENGLWILANEALSFGCDVEFTKVVGKDIANRLKAFSPEILLVPEAKALGFAYCIADELGHKEFAISRKSEKYLTEGSLKVEVKSISTPEKQILTLDSLNLEKIKGRRVAIFDDVISSGGTMRGLMELVEKAGAELSAISTIWIEGKTAEESSSQELLYERLVYLDTLPIFIEEQHESEI
jgi:adenine phosphoribosyltransferase